MWGLLIALIICKIIFDKFYIFFKLRIISASHAISMLNHKLNVQIAYVVKIIYISGMPLTLKSLNKNCH